MFFTAKTARVYIFASFAKKDYYIKRLKFIVNFLFVNKLASILCVVKNKIVIGMKFKPYIIKFIVFIILLIFLCSIFTSCEQYQKIKSSIVYKFTGEEEMNNAEKVVESFFDALINKNYSEAYKYIYSNSIVVDTIVTT